MRMKKTAITLMVLGLLVAGLYLARAPISLAIAKRVAAARSEMAHVGEFDYVTINDNFDVALQDIAAIFRAERLVGSIQMQRHAGLIKTLT